jgi:ATP-dependent helicase/DNAse subunit B
MEISYSKLDSILSCPYKYYLRYIKKVKSKDSTATLYGTVLHNVVRLGYDNNLEEDDWVMLFKKEWMIQASARPDLFKESDDFGKKLVSGQEIISNYYNRFVVGNPPPKETEMRFSKEDNILVGNHYLVGIIDLIDHDNVVIDLKSGNKPSQNEIDFDLQLTFYSYVYRQLFKKKEKGLAIRHFNTTSDIITTRDKKDYDVLLEEINKVDKIVENGVYHRALGRSCNFCFYSDECLGKVKKPYTYKRKK